MRTIIRTGGVVAAVFLLVQAIPGISASITATIAPHGFNAAYMDRTCRACDNFYQFAVGKYAKNHPIPADKTSIGSFQELADRNRATLHAILDAAAQHPDPANAVEKQVGDFYAACMDTATIESAGLRPLERPLAIVDAVRTKSDLPAAAARLQLLSFDPYFGAGSEQDDKDANSQILAVRQGGLGLPDREYYLSSDPHIVAIRDAYAAHVRNLFAMTGSDAAAADAAAKSVMSTETALAQDASPLSALRDPESNYHMLPLPQLHQETPAFSWEVFLRQLGVPKVAAIDMRQPRFFTGFNAVLTRSSVADIKTYLKWRVISRNGSVLPKAIDDEDFAFTSLLTGQKEQQPRWQRCVRATDAGLGEALGQLYVAKAFTPGAKAKALALVNNVQSVLRADISTLPWMSAATRVRALEKLDAYTKKIAYPDTWRKYAFSVGRAAAFDNTLAANLFDSRRDIAKIGKPIDRTEWGQSPPTVNAYYDTNNNEIVFPAGILQPPFYDPNADDAYNYGGIGIVIGHEMTHGFDDQGSQYDAQGNLRSWWTAQDRKEFDARADCVADYYSGLAVLPGVMQNGKLVEGEAIADLGGATIGYKAYMRSLGGKPGATLDGFTPAQRFFLGFAQVWESSMREQTKRLIAATDPHPADANRVNGTVANMPEFAAAWHCPAQAAMARPAAKRCSIW